MTPQTAGRTKPLTIRIAWESYEILAARAKREKKNVSPLAGELLLKGLLPDDVTPARLHQLEERVVELHDQVTKLSHKVREDVATSVAVLLVNAGKCTRAEADAWVKKCLLAVHPTNEA